MQKIKQPRKIMWQRDVRMVINSGICRCWVAGAVRDNTAYVLPHLGSTCAIVPRGILLCDSTSLARYAYYLKGFIKEQCAESTMIFLVILRGQYDILSAETILFMRKVHRQIRLICAEVSDTHFMKLMPSLRDRYMNILQQADEVHSYNRESYVGETEALALTHADNLLLIITERKIHAWQRLVDTIWHDMHHTGDLPYKISQCQIVYMEWIMHQEMYDLNI